MAGHTQRAVVVRHVDNHALRRADPGGAPGLRPEDGMIVISTAPTDEWSFGCGVAGITGVRTQA
ncbi:hypothetical protein ACDA63_19750 [Uliginosibacterium sp. sgz301328]|uniref:hypothetical protein n=1 Tax=Uliginosibacterium sp. sgz301328 TaxID=3243764 RepID=UPI00359E2365